MFNYAGTDLFCRILPLKKHNLFPRRHGTGQSAALHIKHITDQLILLLLQAAMFGAGIHHRHDVIGGDSFLTPHRQFQQLQHAVGQTVE